MSFDLAISFDAEKYAVGATVAVTVAAGDGRTITVDEVRYSSTFDNPFTIDGTTASGVAADIGQLFISATDADGNSAGTHAPIPFAQVSRRAPQ